MLYITPSRLIVFDRRSDKFSFPPAILATQRDWPAPGYSIYNIGCLWLVFWTAVFPLPSWAPNAVWPWMQCAGWTVEISTTAKNLTKAVVRSIYFDVIESSHHWLIALMCAFFKIDIVLFVYNGRIIHIDSNYLLQLPFILLTHRSSLSHIPAKCIQPHHNYDST